MGAVGIPGQASFVTSIAPICIAMGLPIEPLGLLIAVETLPDLMRTLGNVSMDVAATATVARAFGLRRRRGAQPRRQIVEGRRMKYRTLGDGLKVSALGIGCMPMVRGGNINYGGDASRTNRSRPSTARSSSASPSSTPPRCTARSANEELVGEAIRGKREGLVIATKFALRWDGNQPVGFDGSPENARRACEGSLKRLGIDTIDLFYQHRVDPNVPIEETIGGMAELVKEGKVRHLGLSEAAPGDDPPRRRGPSDRRAPVRIFALGARRRGRDPAGLPRARHRLRALQPAWAAAS